MDGRTWWAAVYWVAKDLDTTEQLDNKVRNGQVHAAAWKCWCRGCLRASSVYALTSNAEEAEAEWFYEDLQDLLELTPKKDVLFTIGDWNAKVGSQGICGVTGKFGLGVQNEAV